MPPNFVRIQSIQLSLITTFILACTILQSIAAMDMQLATRPATLIEWTHHCFKNLAEGHDSNVQMVFNHKIPSAVAYEELEKLVKEITQRYKDELNSSQWVGDHAIIDPYLICDSNGLLNGTIVDEEGSLINPVETKKITNKDGTYIKKPKNPPPIAQKIFIPSGSKVAFIGDIHGSITSLLRNLLRMMLLNHLDNNFKLRNNCYLIFTGDLVDRGWYGVEVFYTVLLLKYLNWDKVFILQGNHENYEVSTKYGFIYEFINKYRIITQGIADLKGKPNILVPLYRFFPIVLYLASGQPDNHVHIQCCHGGIDARFDPTEIMNRDLTCFQVINLASSNNFNWGDFFLDYRTYA